MSMITSGPFHFHRAQHCIGTLLFLVALCSGTALAQQVAYDIPLRQPRSVWALGTGQQGVASRNEGEAFAYNPALLANAGGITASMYRHPIYSWCCEAIPIVSTRVTAPVPMLGGFAGIEYVNVSIPTFARRDEANNFLGYFTLVEQSFALGYARALSNDFNTGVALRMTTTRGDVEPGTLWSMSAGLRWAPSQLDGRLRAGLSFTELGDAVKIDFMNAWNASPSSLRLGMEADAVRTDAMEVPILVEVSRPLLARDSTDNAKSSISALTNGWHDAPRDGTLHLGIGFVWKRLSLGRGFAYSQRFAIGNYSCGPKAGSYNVFTASVQACVAYLGIEAELGLGTEWQHLPRDRWALPIAVPREMFEFTLRAPMSLTQGSIAEATPAQPLTRIVLTAGAAWNTHFGQWRQNEEYVPADNAAFEAGAAFYLSESSALVTTFTHEQLERTYYLPSSTRARFIMWTEQTSITALTAAYRLHPLQAVEAWYVEGGGGIAAVRTSLHGTFIGQNKSSYQPMFTIATGAILHASGIVLQPFASFAMLLADMPTSSSPLNLGGNNEARVGLKAGVEL